MTQIVELKNSSSSSVSFSMDESSLMNGFSFKVNRCVSPLAAGKSCKLTLAFKARGLYDGSKLSSLLIESGANSLTLNLSAAVTQQPNPNTTGQPT